MSGIKRDCKTPRMGENIRTYTVDQLKEQMTKPNVVIEQMYHEIERRANLWTKHIGTRDGTIETRARLWDEFGDPRIDRRSCC